MHLLAVLITCFWSFLFILMGVKYRQGKWLRSIAGNTLVGPKDYERPEQRKLGKAVSVVMFSWVIPLTLIGSNSLLRFFGQEELADALSDWIYPSVALVLLIMLIVFVKSFFILKGQKYK